MATTAAKRRRKRPNQFAAAVQAAGHEMKTNPPKILARTERKFGHAREEKQRVAIMLNKARKATGSRRR